MSIPNRVSIAAVCTAASLAFSAPTLAAPVTIIFDGVVSGVDDVLASGPFSVGQLVSGGYTYENDPALNPDINPSDAVGQYGIISWSGIDVGGISLNLTPVSLGIAIFEGGVDGWDAANRVSGIEIGDYTIDSFGISLRDTSGDAFSSDALVPSPPDLALFDIDQSLILFTFNGMLAQVDVDIQTHRVVPLPATLPLVASALAMLSLWSRRRVCR